MAKNSKYIMTIDSMDDKVINKSLFKVELGVHSQLEKGYAADAKRKQLMIQTIPIAACAVQEKTIYDAVIFVDFGRYEKRRHFYNTLQFHKIHSHVL